MQNVIRDIEVYNGFNLRDYQIKTLKKMLKSKNGLAVEIPTGMGKSAIITSAAKLLEKEEKNIFLIYSNESLALRDYIKYKDLYNNCKYIHDKFGFSQENNSSIIFTSITNLAFNYLAGNIDDNELDTCIIDEIDLVTIDHATNFFSISEGESSISVEPAILEVTREFFKGIEIRKCKEIKTDVKYSDDIVVIDSLKRITIGDNVIKEYNKLVSNLGFELGEEIVSLLSVFIHTYQMERHIDYVVVDGKVTPIDKHLCRLSSGSRYSHLEQNILEHREGVELTYSSLVEKSISTQHIIYKFKKIFGLSATITKDIQKELSQTFNINTYKPKVTVKSKLQVNIYEVSDRDYIADKLTEIIDARPSNSILIIFQDNIILDAIKSRIESMYNRARNIKYITLETPIDTELDIISSIGNNDIILSTKMIGRGTDIVSDFITLIAIGVFQERDILQIRGRTARNGSDGEFISIYSKKDKEESITYIKKISAVQRDIRLNNLRYSILEEKIRITLIDKYTTVFNMFEKDTIDQVVRIVLTDFKTVINSLFIRSISQEGNSDNICLLAEKIKEVDTNINKVLGDYKGVLYENE